MGKNTKLVRSCKKKVFNLQNFEAKTHPNNIQGKLNQINFFFFEIVSNKK